MSWRIFPASEEYLSPLRAICIKTFSETYEKLNTPENFRLYIEENFSEERLRKDLNDPQTFTYLLESNGLIEGYLKLNLGSSQTEKVEGNVLELERIYVSKDLHGKGLGKALLEFSINQGKRMKRDFLWLGVWEKNERALQFYESKGFIKFGTHIFRLGDDDQNDHLYRLKL